jgi:hypothetical protein
MQLHIFEILCVLLVVLQSPPLQQLSFLPCLAGAMPGAALIRLVMGDCKGLCPKPAS